MKQLSKNKSYIVLSVIIVSALLLYTYFFFVKKTGYNCDEIYNMALANSYYNPHLYAGNEADFIKEKNIKAAFNEWTTGEIYHDYVTVQKGQQFSYSSVWYNLSKDSHPPVYYALLHTISSFFPDTFSPWFALSINFISFILTMILLYKTGCEWGSPVFFLILCAFYAYSGGAADTYTFIRVYAFSTLLTTAIFYMMSRLLQTGKKRYYLILFIVTLLASLTHYHLILFAFFLTLVTELYLLIKKKWKTFFALGFTMLAGVLVSFAIFPDAIYDLFHDSSVFAGQKMSLYYQIRFIRKLVVAQFTGLALPYMKTYYPIYARSFLLFAAIILLVSFFLFRKEKLAPRFFKKAKEIFWKVIHIVKTLLKHLSFMYDILFLTALCIYIYYIFSLPAAAMQLNTIRYFFSFYPLLCLLIFTLGKELFFSVVHKAINKKILIGSTCAVVLICSLFSNILHTHTFLYDVMPVTGTQMTDLPKDATYIVFVPLAYHRANYAIDLDGVSNLYLICQRESADTAFPASLSTLPESSANEHIYVLFPDISSDNIQIMGARTNDEWLSMIKELPYAEEFTWLGTDCENGYIVEIYQLR